MSEARRPFGTTRARAVGCGAVAVLGAVAAVVVLRPAQPPARSVLRQPAVSTVDAAGPAAGDASRPSQTRRPSAKLITNEYAYRHPGATDAVRSPDWIVTSGSLFSTDDGLWSGIPDGRAPGPTSTAGTDSAVLRAVSTRTDHADVRVTFGLKVAGLVRTPRTPSVNTDGVHAILHYQSEFSTYYVSVFRRDGQITIKKKVPGGPSNGGTYFTLAGKAFAVSPAWTSGWHAVETTIARVRSGVVRLTLRIDGRAALDVVDEGAQAPAVQAPGRVGLRGDNCEFYVRDFKAEPLARP